MDNFEPEEKENGQGAEDVTENVAEAVNGEQGEAGSDARG